MYINVAYVDDENPNIEDLSVPLKINNCGYYRVHTTPVIETPHPEGRNDYQLLYIASGKGYFYFKGSKEPTVVTKGNMVLFRPKEPQVYYYYAEDKTEVYWVHFTGWKVEEYLERYELPKEENVFFTGVSPDYPWIYNQIIRELQLQRENYEDMIRLFLRHIFLTINRYIKEGKQTKNDTINDIERAVHYFNENYSKPISIEQYASEHLMSVNWFIHSFKNVMKVPPMQYIVSLRIAAAKGYLENSNKNISEIAATVGYDNALYFSRLFRKNTGVTPTEYRQRSKILIENQKNK
ncbi:MAG: helix-turn-helix domain-containing protein [Clostridia bacterium]|nr:helix-turn-helix domain-containing protein [Clostridia bacterium]MBR5321737.1 helix-turn-helix domain-containing protein [Clostridia bacterium]